MHILQGQDQLLPRDQCPLPLKKDVVLVQLPGGYTVLPCNGPHRVTPAHHMGPFRQQHHQSLPRHQRSVRRRLVELLQQTGGHAVLLCNGEKSLPLLHHMDLHIASSSRLPRSTQAVYAPARPNRRNGSDSPGIYWGNICGKEERT